MSTMIYNYTWVTDWSTTIKDKKAQLTSPSDEELKADLKQAIEKATLQKMTEEFARLGRWLKVDSVTIEIKNFTLHGGQWWLLPHRWDASGTSTITFETDISPTETSSPDLTIAAVLIALLAAIVVNMKLVLVLAIVLAFFWGLSKYSESGGVEGTIFGKNAGLFGDIGTFIIVIVLLLVLAGALPTIITLAKGWFKGRKKAKPKKAKP